MILRLLNQTVKTVYGHYLKAPHTESSYHTICLENIKMMSDNGLGDGSQGH